MNSSPILTFIIFRSHLMEVERNQFSLLLREAYCLNLRLEYVHMSGWGGGRGGGGVFSRSALSLTLGIFPSFGMSLMYDSLLLPFVFIFYSRCPPCDYPSAYQRLLMKIHNIFPSQLIPYQRRNLVPENQFSFIILSPPLMHLHVWFLWFRTAKQQWGT